MFCGFNSCALTTLTKTILQNTIPKQKCSFLKDDVLFQRGEIFSFRVSLQGKKTHLRKNPSGFLSFPESLRPLQQWSSGIAHKELSPYHLPRRWVFFVFLKWHPIGRVRKMSGNFWNSGKSWGIEKNVACNSQFTGKWVKIHWKSWMYLANTDNSYVLISDCKGLHGVSQNSWSKTRGVLILRPAAATVPSHGLS